MLYEYTITKIKKHTFNDTCNENYQHLIWMCDEISKMSDSLKAARWIGYVLRMIEDLGFWDNTVSRDYIREDVKNGNDK